MIYLDHALYTPVFEPVQAHMKKLLEQIPDHCADAPYARSQSPSLDPIYQLAQASQQDHFVFTSSGAEAVNQVIMGVYTTITKESGKHHFVCSQIDEAPAILSMTRQKEFGCLFSMIPVVQAGYITIQTLTETISPRTVLLSLSWANGLSGVIQPLDDIVNLCRERGILLHVDATHVLGKGDFSFQDSGIDFLTFDGAAIGAPMGTGGLFIRSGLELDPLILGGKQQMGMRAGTLNPILLEGLIQTAQLLVQQSDLFCLQTASLRNQLENKLKAQTVNFFADVPRVPHISLLGFPHMASECLCYLLAKRKIYTNMGGGQMQQVMHLLKHCAVDPKLHHCGLSFALGADTSMEQIEMAVEHIQQLHLFGRQLTECLI